MVPYCFRIVIKYMPAVYIMYVEAVHYQLEYPSSLYFVSVAGIKWKGMSPLFSIIALKL